MVGGKVCVWGGGMGEQDSWTLPPPLQIVGIPGVEREASYCIPVYIIDFQNISAYQAASDQNKYCRFSERTRPMLN